VLGVIGIADRRLLVIERDPPLRTVLNRGLRFRFEVQLAESTERALDDVRRNGAPTVIFGDLVTIGDGEAFEASLESIARGTADRAVYTTAGFVDVAAQAFLNRLPGRWIPKPYTISNVLDLLAVVTVT